MNSSWLIFELIKALEIIPAVITQIFNPTVVLAIPIGIPTEEAKAEMDIHQVIVEITISDWSV